MRKQAKIAVSFLCIVASAMLTWRMGPSPEPSYEGQSLTHWLDRYNEAERTEGIAVSDAIRAMGTNTLPYLLRHLRQKPSTLKLNLFLVAEEYHLALFSPPRITPYLGPSLLALRALGSTAKPLVPDLLRMFEDNKTMAVGGLALFSIGTESIPAFEEACSSTNSTARIEAAIFLAVLPNDSHSEPDYLCTWSKFRANSPLQVYVTRPWSKYLIVDLASQARNHRDVAVRRASIEALANYNRTSQNDQPQTVAKTLRKAMNDPDAGVRQAAVEALKEMDCARSTSTQSAPHRVAAQPVSDLGTGAK